MKRLSLSLTLRSLILTAFLILSQLAFILVLSNVLQQSQSKIEAQWRSENLLRICFSLCRAASDLLIYIQMPPGVREMIGVEANSTMARARRETSILKDIAAQDPLKREALGKLLAADAELTSMMDTLLLRVSALRDVPMSFGGPAYFRKTLKKHGNAFYDAVEEIVSIEKKQHEVDRAGPFSTVIATLIAAVGFSILVAIVLGFAYAVSIRRPLKHLSENGRLLSTQKELLPQLDQSDEFGTLDAILHTTSREMEATLQSERDTIENAADLICTLDENGIFVHLNPFAQKMLGQPPEAILGTSINSLTVPEQSLLADEHVRNSVNSADVQQFELRLLGADGEILDTRWSSLWSSVERKIFCVVRDVTEEKKIEQLKQDFADMISHDLRSPLMAMGNALTLLKSGVKGNLPAAALQRIDTSARNVDRLIVLVNDLLDFQKLKAGKMELLVEEFPIEGVIVEAASMVEEAARENDIEMVLPNGNTSVCGDRIKLMQVAVNLISNAIKFSGKGGTVKVEVSSDLEFVSLSVSDTGPGVPEDFQQRIFEPFEQAPSAKKKEGTGLGLAICRLVVEAHLGTIKVENRTEGGSVFTVNLPANKPVQQEAVA